MQLMDGKKLAQSITNVIKEQLKNLRIKPTLAIVQVGEIESSTKYVNYKLKKAIELGIKAELFNFAEDVSFDELKRFFKKHLNKFSGIMVQLPLPGHLDKQKVCDLIPYKKDIDGLTSKNNSKFYSNQVAFTPATANAILNILDYYGIDVYSKKCGVIGQSDLVGKPVSYLLRKKGAIVNTYDISTGIDNIVENDVLIVAAGVAHLVDYTMVKEGCVVIDVGTNIDKHSEYKLMGDVNPEKLEQKASYLAPVPGGIGPLTVVSLFYNLIFNPHNS
ncbi:bifunctional protein FolD [Mycoplasmopsis californica]|uniref:Bifunctional protein FolD n=1 Tax=Mycoplasmopsis equigenitalium TaxID=114883 RepID=A0ABY5J1N9_9BACT|nr:bifunctional 5,10-methylenetetrahydrofolate dehydrogenase/5,10-methenyltetrahydrofolate cyclohydrolase [Mycoplasmopsis equigenitalium]UUD37129.1 bifunctional 5,10-methylenetetrahydrofolate dehydrogenase/5,10-methenyltetrahydrofolate cyclohydrolase [Mycoplasmopsis equigenitalium]VEU69565.1 bifunctional protein FolD [Mycoplasmopsis californica]